MGSKKSGFTAIQKWTLMSTILASSLVYIDSTALNFALPALQKDLDITGTELLWVINAYTLFLSALLLVGGSLGDIFGRNKVFLTGLGIFSISSFICGISGHPQQLIIARAFQGIGGALLTPGSLSILSSKFGAEKRGNAIGLWSTFSALTAVFGPVLGGWLAGSGLWRVIFFINVPLTIIVFVIMIFRIPESRNPDAEKLDIWGALLVTLGLSGITYGFIESPKNGFGNLITISSLIIGGFALIVFIVVQSYSKHPMMQLKLFKSSTFSGGSLLTLLVYAALFIALFFLPLNLIQLQGYSEVNAGLAMLPIVILIAFISPFMGKFADRKGVQIPLIVGPIITSAGFLIFSTFDITSGAVEYWNTFFLAFLVLGIGMGITVAPLTTAVMGAVSEDNVGIAAGINSTLSRVAGLLALAIMGAFVLFSFSGYVKKGIDVMDISESMKNEIMFESIKFTAAKAPDGLSDGNKVIIEKLMNDSLVEVFKMVAFVASALTFLAGLIALIFIKNKTVSAEKLQLD